MSIMFSSLTALLWLLYLACGPIAIDLVDAFCLPVIYSTEGCRIVLTVLIGNFRKNCIDHRARLLPECPKQISNVSVHPWVTWGKADAQHAGALKCPL